MATSQPPLVHLLRHGQALHNIDRTHPHPDPPLTPDGHTTASAISSPFTPDLLLSSPLSRAIQTGLNAFPSLPASKIQIWPELRETHDQFPCNIGSSRAVLQERFPGLDFEKCGEEWVHDGFTHARAVERAESVRRALRGWVEAGYRDVVVVVHRGFAAFLVEGARFENCEMRSYRFAKEKEVEERRLGRYVETGKVMDFGPTVLVPWDGGRDAGVVSGVTEAYCGVKSMDAVEK